MAADTLLYYVSPMDASHACIHVDQQICVEESGAIAGLNTSAPAIIQALILVEGVMSLEWSRYAVVVHKGLHFGWHEVLSAVMAILAPHLVGRDGLVVALSRTDAEAAIEAQNTQLHAWSMAEHRDQIGTLEPEEQKEIDRHNVM
jgi:hypothetical protein